MPLPPIDPPLLNSSNPWATTKEDLQRLFDCEHTGAVTIRTSLLDGFAHDDEIHQHTFFSPLTHAVKSADAKDGEVASMYSSSLNTLGYSPIPLREYLSMLPKVVADSSLPEEKGEGQPFIISVTGSAEAVRECHHHIQETQATMRNPLCMEINLSCPNIPSKPPPAYSGEALKEYLDILTGVETLEGQRRVAIGIKTPPYTYHDQFQTLIDALSASSSGAHQGCPIDFITATNTLGSSLVLSEGSSALSSASGQGLGGMAGTALHPLALGNVKTIRGMLDAREELRGVDLVGVGGVGDAEGFKRMRAVGAKVVGVGTALGREGVGVFERIGGSGE